MSTPILDPVPINVTRDRQIRARTHAVCIGGFVFWFLTIGIVVGVVASHFGMGAGVAWLIALLGTGPAWLLTVPLTLLIFRKHFRDYGQDDIPTVAPKPGPTLEDLYPEIKRDRSKIIRYTNVIGHSSFRASDYPMVELLDEDWANRFRYLPDEALSEAKGEMCNQVLHNWNVAHPNAPVSAKKPAWFENMDEQAEALLYDLQTSEVIIMGSAKSSSPEEYFRQHGRFPDGWYASRGLPVPPPGPDPDWKLSNPAKTLAAAAVVAGSVYMGGWRPIARGLKRL